MSEKIAVCKTITTDLDIVVNPPTFRVYGIPEYRNEEEYFKMIKDWAEGLERFLHQHSEYQNISMRLERKQRDVCSVCTRPWEPTTDEDRTYCAWCGATIEKTEAADEPRND